MLPSFHEFRHVKDWIQRLWKSNENKSHQLVTRTWVKIIRKRLTWRTASLLFVIFFCTGFSWDSLSRHIVHVYLKMISFSSVKAGYPLKQQIRVLLLATFYNVHFPASTEGQLMTASFLLLMYLLRVCMLLFSTLKQLLILFWVFGIIANSPRMRSSQADCHFSALCQHFLDGDRIVLTTT